MSNNDERPATDPTITDPDKYRVVFENDRVRVLEYRDEPGQKTSPHTHPDSVVHILSSFRRRFIGAGGQTRDAALSEGRTLWIDAQTHSGENIGDTPSHALFVELKDSTKPASGTALGPSS